MGLLFSVCLNSCCMNFVSSAHSSKSCMLTNLCLKISPSRGILNMMLPLSLSIEATWINFEEKSIPTTSSKTLVSSKEVLPTAQPRSITLNFSSFPLEKLLCFRISSQTMAHVMGNRDTLDPLISKFDPQWNSL